MLVADLLARSNDGEGVKSGPLGLAIILVLCVAVYFLMKSMSKHLKKVRDEFPTDEKTVTAPRNSIQPVKPTPTSLPSSPVAPPRADSP
jgi:hypothetical protein